MTPGVTGPVLDRDRLDDAADRMLGGLRIDVAAALAEGRTRARRARRRRLLTTAGVVAATAAVVLAVFAGLTPGVLAQPEPARVPDGPGAVPVSVRVPPPWTPSATESPLSRVAYVVLDARPFDTRLSGSGHRVWLVGADGGEYRYLPVEDPRRVAVSPDGAYVTWFVADERHYLEPAADVLRILKVSTGAMTSVPFPGIAGRGFAVEGTAFAPAGHRLAVWGRNRVAAGTQTTPELEVVDVADQRPRIAHVCSCEPQAGATGFGFGPEGTPGPVHGLPLGTLPAAPVQDGDGPPGGLPGTISQPPLLAPDGRTLYAIAGEQLTEPSETSVGTYRYSLRTPNGGPVALGDGSAVVGLGVGGRGAVISLWKSAGRGEKVGTGPGTVLVVDPGRGTATRVTRTEDTARVIAAATDVLDGGRTAPAAGNDRWSDVDWWTWHGGRLAGWVGGVPVWAVVLVGLVGLLGAGRVAPLPRPGARVVRTAAGGVAVVAVVAVAGAGVVLVAGWLLGSPAAGPAASGGTAPVIPRLLTDQHREPPRAFDAPGVPVTRRVTAVFDAEIAGSQGQYALDAATGRTVRLYGLPGLSPGDRPRLWSVSPNGRYLVSDGALVDLETARARQTTTVPDLTGLAVLNDGTVVTTDRGGSVWVERATGGAARVATLSGTYISGPRPASGPYALLQLETGRPAAAVLDVRTGRIATTPLPAGDATAPLAVSPAGEVVSASGTPVAAAIRNGERLMRPERTVGVSDGGRPVYLSPTSARADTPLEIRRAGERTLTQVRVDVALIRLAADVVAAARPVDVEEPGWAVVADPDSRALAARILGAGVLAGMLAVLLSGTAAAAAPRRSPAAGGRRAATPPTAPTGSPGPP